MKDKFTIVIICGSVRPGNMTRNAVRALENELQRLGVATALVDPVNLRLPLPGLSSGDDIDSAALKKKVESASPLGAAFAEKGTEANAPPPKETSHA